MEGAPSRELEATKEFREFLGKNPGALKSFLHLEKVIDQKIKDRTLDLEARESFEDGLVTVTPVYKIIESSRYPKYEELGDYLKVDVGGESFFVKRVTSALFYDATDGISELRSLKIAQDVLRDIPRTDVIDFKLGYQDDNGRTYFVSKWLNLPTVSECIEGGNTQIKRRYDEIYNRLQDHGFRDVHEDNMLYDKETDKIYVFDVFHASEI